MVERPHAVAGNIQNGTAHDVETEAQDEIQVMGAYGLQRFTDVCMYIHKGTPVNAQSQAIWIFAR